MVVLLAGTSGYKAKKRMKTAEFRDFIGRLPEGHLGYESVFSLYPKPISRNDLEDGLDAGDSDILSMHVSVGYDSESSDMYFLSQSIKNNGITGGSIVVGIFNLEDGFDELMTYLQGGDWK